MSEFDCRLDREEIVEQAVRAAQTGRLAVILAEQPVCAGLLGDAAVMLMEAGVDVARLDALEAHSPDDVRHVLCHALGLDESALIEGLRFRGETGNPFCLVVDGGECLDGKAFILLKTLLEQTSGGLGLLLAGEPDLGVFLDDFNLTVSWRYELEPDYPLANEPAEADAGAAVAFPWKHVAAAAGLALLVILFWPSNEPDSEAEVRTLALPDPPRDIVVPEPEEEPEPILVSQQVSNRPADHQVADDSSKEESAAAALSVSDAEPDQLPPRETAVADVEPEPARTPSSTATAKVTAPAPARDARSEPPQRQAAPVVAQDPALSGLDAELNYRREDWLLAQKADQWVLQVALATTENGARSLLDRIGRDRSAYYRAQRDGRSVYIVVAGPWSDRKSAVDARPSLPEDLRRLGPFPRQVEHVQRELTP